MSYDTSAYAFFGVHIPRDQYQAGGNQTQECGWLDAVIRNTPELTGQGLGHVTAGRYDADELFLAVSDPADKGGVEIELGTFKRMDTTVPLVWTMLLERLVREAGYDQSEIQPPTWIALPDVS